MMRKTHIVISIAVALYFLPFIEHKLLFIPIVLVGGLFPDIDSMSSGSGNKLLFRPVQAVFKHRGPLHSYTFSIGLTLILAFFWPIHALPFFLGYSFHIWVDSFTRRGIRPFWPLRFESKGAAKTGGVIDRTIFWTFVIINLFLLVLFIV
jgi:membrane-bound metal-dependent hydrolase YbcI (DUF457 family)